MWPTEDAGKRRFAAASEAAGIAPRRFLLSPERAVPAASHLDVLLLLPERGCARRLVLRWL
jgi:hypothetical protein